jgi:putative phosphoribosyl transferase
MRFYDRAEAGKKLADALGKYKGQPAVIYALPRGGVVLGAIIARRLGAELDVAIPRKVGHPVSHETAVCAVSEEGYRLCNELLSTVSEGWLEQATKKEIAEAKRRREAYLGDRSQPSVRDKLAIIIDDGIATGLTMRVAIHDIKQRRPAKVIVAVPIAPSDAAEQISAEVDEFVALDIITSGYFGAVGAYYENFAQVSDEEVIQLLQSVPSPATRYDQR